MASVNEEAHYLHWSFNGSTHVLFAGLYLDSFATFAVASLLVIFLCSAERFLSFLIEEEWAPRFASRSRWKTALWNSSLYWITTLLRLAYMLCAMSFHVGLLLVIATALASAHFLVQLRKESRLSRGSYSSIEEPSFHDDIPNPTLPLINRPRSKSKPDGIFIHPQHSNLARADAAAIQLGLGGPTERVSRGGIPQMNNEPLWQAGSGRNAARALLSTNDHFDIGSSD
ncbi:hypothetical protein D9757_010841 [Collybiopsis confluens]|uniref:Copper transporter n=1 Tax=Collybiopsis confluens TaxID=2823264 RepID=A0A8H5LR61_9AGAR|nr:hypothetical protein D9757_010841 [Collybiopsis confluens]